MWKKAIITLALSASGLGAVGAIEVVRPAPADAAAFMENTFSLIKNKEGLNPAILLGVGFLEGVCYILPPLALVGAIGGAIASNTSRSDNKETWGTISNVSLGAGALIALLYLYDANMVPKSSFNPSPGMVRVAMERVVNGLS